MGDLSGKFFPRYYEIRLDRRGQEVNSSGSVGPHGITPCGPRRPSDLVGDMSCNIHPRYYEIAFYRTGQEVNFSGIRRAHGITASWIRRPS